MTATPGASKSDVCRCSLLRYRSGTPTGSTGEPYMSRAGLLAEIASGVEFWGWDEAGIPAGVMGDQRVRDVTLIRHAHVRPSHQSRGPALTSPRSAPTP